jgi:hypothetical protein
MRTNMQQRYDRLYHGLELRIFQFYRNLHKYQATRSLHFDAAFRRAYRTQVLPYWKRYGIRPKRCWYKFFYQITGEIDPRYIPDDIHHRYIIPYFDRVEYIRPLEDKNLHSLLLPQANRPETVFKFSAGDYCNDDFSPIPYQEALARCLEPGRYILKPTRDTGEGMNICFFSGEDGEKTIQALLDSYGGNDYIVQKVLTQHPDMARMNPTSVNTVRVVTLVRNGQAQILSTIVRIGGQGNLLDNIAQGGYQAVVDENGCLKQYAYTHKGGKDMHVEQTDSGFRFAGYPIPCWPEIQKTALDLALRLPHLKLIGWDFMVNDQSQVVMIEYNCDFGQNQENCGPTFGDQTDEILDEIFITKRKDLLS